MNELDENYKMLLNAGFIVIREALRVGSINWANAEIEMLHNVPSLIGESNIHRHEYYWEKERAAYVEWIRASGNEYALSRMTVFYHPIWESIGKEIESFRSRRAFCYDSSPKKCTVISNLEPSLEHSTQKNPAVVIDSYSTDTSIALDRRSSQSRRHEIPDITGTQSIYLMT